MIVLHKEFNMKIDDVLYGDRNFILKNLPLIPEVKSIMEKTLYKDHVRR